MAKANTVAYLVTDKAISLSYNGKNAFPGDVVSDFPGESISWLLSDGLIVAAPSAAPAPTPDPTPSVDETPASDSTDTSAETAATN